MCITTFNSLTSQDRMQCWVNPSIVLHAMTRSKAFSRANLMITVDVIMCYGILDRVESTIAVDAIVCDATFAGVESTITVDVMACYATPEWVDMIATPERVDIIITPERVEMITTPEWVDMITTLAREELTIAVDAMTCYGTFDRVILRTPEWVNMITFARTELTAFEWVNSTITVWINMIFPEWVDIVQEWLLVTQSKVNVSALYLVNGTNCGLVIGEHLMNHQITCHAPKNTLMSCMITISVHDSSKNNHMGCSLLKIVVVLNEQSSVVYNAMQPTS